ncbi:MAG: hypothetical protein GF398_15175 [Chitinivibrionales bacterium]|nr:hypothetical protein [Chitinivibrionales bacterium]
MKNMFRTCKFLAAKLRLQLAFLLLFMLLAYLSCTAPTDPTSQYENVSVEVQVSQPANGVSYLIGDTITVTTRISLPEFITHLQIDINDSLVADTSIATLELKETLQFTRSLFYVDTNTITAIATFENGEKKTYEHVINVDGYQPLVLDTSLQTLYINEGDLCTLTTHATGTGPFSYVWKKDGAPLSETSSSLTLTIADASLEGVYQYSVTNKWGSDNSEPFVIKMIATGTPSTPGQFEAQLIDSTVILTWGTVDSVDGFKVYQYDSTFALDQPIDTLTSTQITIPYAGTDYKYALTAFKGAKESPPAFATLTAIQVTNPSQAPFSWKSNLIQINVPEASGFQLNLLDSIELNGTAADISFAKSSGSDKITINRNQLSFSTNYYEAGSYVGQVTATLDTFSAKSVIVFNVTEAYCTLTVNSANGNVALSPDQTIFRKGDSVSVSVTANTDYRFVKWEDDAQQFAQQQSINIFMDNSKIVSALYELQTACINITPGTLITETLSNYSKSENLPAQICPVPGLYQNNTVRISGKVKFILTK